MEKTESPKTLSSPATDLLEREENWDNQILVKYEGTWYVDFTLQPLLSARTNFRAKDGDVIVASLPKSGTTWLVALALSIAKRGLYPPGQSPLLTAHPQEVVGSLEFNHYLKHDNPDLEGIPSPRIFSTHAPHVMLPDSVRESDNCRIIYICRNPLDRFVSVRQFLLANLVGMEEAAPPAIDQEFDKFCRGIDVCGPFWEHILGYWKEHLENPRKVLFIHYEEMKEDPVGHVNKIAEFLGCPFTAEEEKQGMAEEIAKLCSFETLKNIEANKQGYLHATFKKSTFFREGKVGNWSNYLSPKMAEDIEKIIEAKFKGTGINIKTKFHTNKGTD
ncbi:cytosolic sulfotransferase 5-like [Andrographis paniculata]|uniref:cytosolic sulfotransferase 5-like n=1 Tax=Andrographis paniculata TaxID=175694 RepID=UPI0021E8F93F|nr:cytosolic sulfotransferase 5-like [Andrographis paniculata]